MNESTLTFQNIVDGFETDIENHISVLEAMCEDEEKIHKMKCDQCKYKNNSERNS